MRIIICDDEPLMAETIKKNIEDYFNNSHISCPEIIEYTDGNQMLSDTGDKDIVFMDIDMAGMDGLHLGRELYELNKNTIIFVVTSHSEYLDDAMRFNVFRYLTKPIDKQRFMRNMKDAIDKYNSITLNVPIETKTHTYTVPASDIIAIEARNRKVIIHTVKGDYDSTKNMAFWYGYLPKNKFFRTHRSYIVNFEHITEFTHMNINLCNGQINAYLTRRRYVEFKDRYLLFLESMR